MNNNDKKVVNVSTKKEVVVQKPKVEDFDVSKSIEEHMKENQENIKTKIDYKTIFTYVIMVIIVLACVLLLVHFCEDSISSLNKNTTTTNLNYQLIPPTTKKNNSVEYVRPSTIPTAATHTVFVGNKTNVASTKQPDRTNNVEKKTTITTTTTKVIDTDDEEKTTESTTVAPSTGKSEETTTNKTETTEKTESVEDSENHEEVGDN